MKHFLSHLLAFLLIVILLATPATVLAQEEEPELQLSMSRDFGYSSGTGQIQGTFSIKASGPATLAIVVFLLDGETMNEDTEAPFRYQFSTDTYAPGIHTLTAVGYTQDGLELQGREITTEFVTAEEGSQAAMRIVIPLLAVIVGLTVISFVIPTLFRRGKSTPLGAQRNYGLTGGAICPKCQRPFVLNFMSLNLLIGKLDRCPHCGKWSLVHRTPIEMLRVAEQAELAQAQGNQAGVEGLSEEEKLKKALDDSRYQDV
jgi:hypothetical protein